jgi:hypothetical protein
MTQIRLHKNGKSITDIETWFSYAPPKKGALQWKDGYSAKEFARSFFSPTLPDELEALLATRFNPPFEVEGEPECVVKIDALRGEHPNLDLAAIVSHSSGVVALAIEAKVAEPFGSIIGEKLAPKTGKAPSLGTMARIKALRKALCQSLDEESFLKLRYQLLYGIAAALCHAKTHSCPAAIYIAHTLGRPSAKKWTDNQKAYCDLLSALGAASPDQIHEGELFGPVTVNGNDYIPKDVELYIGKVSRSQILTNSHAAGILR